MNRLTRGFPLDVINSRGFVRVLACNFSFADAGVCLIKYDELTFDFHILTETVCTLSWI